MLNSVEQETNGVNPAQFSVQTIIHTPIHTYSQFSECPFNVHVYFGNQSTWQNPRYKPEEHLNCVNEDHYRRGSD